MMHSEARIDTEMEPVPLTTLIQERMAELEPLASARRIELEFFSQDDIWIAGVRERLVSLIDNLIENAVKYSPEGGGFRSTYAHSMAARSCVSRMRGPVFRLNCGNACSTVFSATRIRCKAEAVWGLPSSKRWRSSTTAALT